MDSNTPETPVLKLSERTATMLVIGMFLSAATMGVAIISLGNRETDDVAHAPPLSCPPNVLFAIERNRSSLTAYSTSALGEDAQTLFELLYVVMNFEDDDFVSFFYYKDDTVEVRFSERLPEDELRRRAKKYTVAVSVVARSQFRSDREAEILWKKRRDTDASYVVYDMALVAPKPKPEDKG